MTVYSNRSKEAKSWKKIEENCQNHKKMTKHWQKCIHAKKETKIAEKCKKLSGNGNFFWQKWAKMSNKCQKRAQKIAKKNSKNDKTIDDQKKCTHSTYGGKKSIKIKKDPKL